MKKLFEPNPSPLDCCHAIPFANFQSKLARTVKNHISDIHDSVLCIRSYGNVGELEKFFNGREYGRDWVSRMVGCLLDSIFALKDIVGHQLTVVIFEVSQHVRHGAVD